MCQEIDPMTLANSKWPWRKCWKGRETIFDLRKEKSKSVKKNAFFFGAPPNKTILDPRQGCRGRSPRRTFYNFLPFEPSEMVPNSIFWIVLALLVSTQWALLIHASSLFRQCITCLRGALMYAPDQPKWHFWGLIFQLCTPTAIKLTIKWALLLHKLLAKLLRINWAKFHVSVSNILNFMEKWRY